MATRDIKCEGCATVVGNFASPVSLPEDVWAMRLAGYRCNNPACQPQE